MVVMLLLPLVMVTAGAFLLARGLRGRVVDDHPVCRGCRQPRRESWRPSMEIP